MLQQTQSRCNVTKWILLGILTVTYLTPRVFLFATLSYKPMLCYVTLCSLTQKALCKQPSTTQNKKTLSTANSYARFDYV